MLAPYPYPFGRYFVPTKGWSEAPTLWLPPFGGFRGGFSPKGARRGGEVDQVGLKVKNQRLPTKKVIVITRRLKTNEAPHPYILQSAKRNKVTK